jgi:hypothetical protein
LLPAQAQDTSSIQNGYRSDWACGFSLGATYPMLTGSARELINTTTGFTWGIEVEYKLVFLKLLFSSPTGKVRKVFELSGTWPNTLPLDIDYFTVGLGYRVNVSRKLSIKPMLTQFDLGLKTDDEVKDFTGIDRSVTLHYYGIAFASILHVYEEREYDGLEFIVGVGWPFNSTHNPQLANAVWHFSLALLVLPVN